RTPPGWNSATKISCVNHRFKVTDENNAEIAAFPLGIRCVRKSIDYYFKEEDCIANEECRKVVKFELYFNCIVSTFHFRMEISEWKTIASARCDSDKFTISDGAKVEKVEATGVKCIRLKCTFCENPCPNCANASFTFTPSTKWNECAEF
ncbi:hypothetical protein PMAYCL1PPCAC_13608, partial [Pristionchus mayeri]